MDLLAAMPPILKLSPEELNRVAVQGAGHAIVGAKLGPDTLVRIAISDTVIKGRAVIHWEKRGSRPNRRCCAACNTIVTE
jgi:hypothetical protein